MKRLSLIIYTLVFLSIFRVLFIPLVGSSLASSASGLISILLAFIFTFLLKEKIDLLFLKTYSIFLLIPIFFTDGVYIQILYDLLSPIKPTFLKISAAFFETIAPYIILSGFSNKFLVKKVMIRKNTFKKVILFFILFLLLGHVLNLIGIRLPTIADTPISSWGATNIDQEAISAIKFRVSSFVGSSGPYALSMAYLTITYAILNPRNKIYIFFIAFLIQVTSFSRSGFMILFIYVLVSYMTKVSRIFNLKNFIPGKKALLSIFLIATPLLYLIVTYSDLLLFQAQRIFYLLTLLNDQGNFNRLERMNMALPMIFSNFNNFFIGFGTGVTSKSLGGEQFESQLVKIFVEWGFIGILLTSFWLIKTFKLLNKELEIKVNYLPIAATVVFNLFVVQAFTSAPIFVSMGMTLLALNFEEEDELTNIYDNS